MPELPPEVAKELDARPRQECAVCGRKIIHWYCEVCDEFAFDCDCRSHREEELHRDMMAARRRPF